MIKSIKEELIKGIKYCRSESKKWKEKAESALTDVELKNYHRVYEDLELIFTGRADGLEYALSLINYEEDTTKEF